jgi:hypothetical protein
MHGADCEAAYEQCDYYLHNGTLRIEFAQQHQQCMFSVPTCIYLMDKKQPRVAD